MRSVFGSRRRTRGGSVPGTAGSLGVDLPEPRPISITPLAPPAPDEASRSRSRLDPPRRLRA